ncbi:MAG: type II secretion system F family protein [Chloroflexi bacterium]|nr:type II secretion system F family protein [Chloroflexota bacterium]
MASKTDSSLKKEKIPTYRYVATTVHGKTVQGNVKATSEIAAERIIISKGLDPVHVHIAPSMFSLEEALPSLYKVKTRDVVIFSRQLATLLRSGISLLPAMDILESQAASSRAFKSIQGTIVNDIRSGVSFSVAISKHPKAFNDIYCRTIEVGEETGNLETVLLQMATYLEKQSELTKKVSKALSYPIMILSVAVVVIVLLMTVVMPPLLDMFTSMSVDLPLPTRILIAVSGFATNNTLYILAGAVVLVVLILWLVKQPTGRRLLDKARLSMPILGPPALMSELGRFARTISVLVGTGLTLQEIMEMLPHSTTNRVFRDALDYINERLVLGEGLAAPMSQQSLFPPLLVQMVAVGEESNTLDFTMGVVADFYEASAEEKIDVMVGLIGPVSTIGIALLVGFIAMSVIMPMYTLTGSF